MTHPVIGCGGPIDKIYSEPRSELTEYILPYLGPVSNAKQRRRGPQSKQHNITIHVNTDFVSMTPEEWKARGDKISQSLVGERGPFACIPDAAGKPMAVEGTITQYFPDNGEAHAKLTQDNRQIIRELVRAWPFFLGSLLGAQITTLLLVGFG